MTLEKLAESEVLAIEAQIDAQFERIPLPALDLNTARWLLCVVNEDISRLTLREAVKTWYHENARPDRAAFVGRLDRFKYALRQALDLCSKQLPVTDACGPVPINAENYTPAAHLLRAADEFAAATRIFSSYHAKRASLLIDRDTGFIELARERWAFHYGSLEFLLNSDKGDFSATLSLVNLFSGPSFDMPAINSTGHWSPTIHEIVKRAKLKNGRINYKLITRFARDLFDHFNVAPSLPPQYWRFPWATMREAQSYFAALQAISIYHLLSIHFGATRQGLKGLGLDQICLSSERRHLAEDIARISGLADDVAAAVTDALTLGTGTTTPDPALQPLILIGCGRLAVPGSVILSSKWSRNMLSLHARVSEDSFNANSSAFERSMIAALKPELPARFSYRTSIYIPTSNGPEEIDLILIDESKRFILLGELRWMLQPGDVREVLNRKKAIQEKVHQARRKVIGARAETDEMLRKLGLARGDWSIGGVVIIDGFGGTVSDHPKDVPVVPRDIFVRVLDAAVDLEHAHAVMSTPLWLPREGIDFELLPERSTICGVPFNRTGIGIGNRSFMLESLPQYLAEAFALPVAELNSLRW